MSKPMSIRPQERQEEQEQQQKREPKTKNYTVLGLKRRDSRHMRTGTSPVLTKEVQAGSAQEAADIFERENSYYKAMTVNGKELKGASGGDDNET